MPDHANVEGRIVPYDWAVADGGEDVWEAFGESRLAHDILRADTVNRHVEWFKVVYALGRTHEPTVAAGNPSLVDNHGRRCTRGTAKRVGSLEVKSDEPHTSG